MVRMPFTGDTAPRHTAAALAAAIGLGVGVALIATSGGAGPHAKTTPAAAAATTAPRVATYAFPHAPAGAVAAATAWCQNTGEAFFKGTWDSAAAPLAARSFLSRAERLQPASDLMHSRLAAAHAPYAVRFWPLGYAVQEYSPAAARVRVWQLLVFGSSGPLSQTTFYTTTVSLRWVDGDWKITASPPGPDLRPPGRNAGASQVATWVGAVGQLNAYSYAP
jgi:hypothetical protein